MTKAASATPCLPELFLNHGDFTMAYSVVVDENIALFESGHGILGYADTGKMRLFVGDPMCTQKNIDGLVDAFLEHSAGARVVGLQCSRETGEAFHRRGYNATLMGVETILDVAGFDLKGKRKTKVRRWVNTARNAGLMVTEGRVEGNQARMREISRQWLECKPSEELKILLRPMPNHDTPHARVFFAADDEMQGFVVFDPMFRDGRVMGYYADICRFSKTAPNGTFDLIINTALDVFRAEGVEQLSFGLSPLAEVRPCVTDNAVVRAIARINFAYGESMYPFQGIDFHKRAYHLEPQSLRRPVYCITKGCAPVMDIIRTFGAVGIIPAGNPLAPLGHVARGVLRSWK